MKIDRYDVLTVLGLLVLLAGLASFDWRWAVVALGVVVFLAGIMGAVYSQPRRRR